MRDQCTTIKTYGKTTVVVTTHRNANATAFAAVIIEDVWGVRFKAEARSQGPSSGGFNKEAQALGRLASKLNLPKDDKRFCYIEHADTLANAVASLAESHRVAGTAPPWEPAKA